MLVQDFEEQQHRKLVSRLRGVARMIAEGQFVYLKDGYGLNLKRAKQYHITTDKEGKKHIHWREPGGRWFGPMQIDRSHTLATMLSFAYFVAMLKDEDLMDLLKYVDGKHEHFHKWSLRRNKDHYYKHEVEAVKRQGPRIGGIMSALMAFGYGGNKLHLAPGHQFSYDQSKLEKYGKKWSDTGGFYPHRREYLRVLLSTMCKLGLVEKTRDTSVRPHSPGRKPLLYTLTKHGNELRILCEQLSAVLSPEELFRMLYTNRHRQIFKYNGYQVLDLLKHSMHYTYLDPYISDASLSPLSPSGVLLWIGKLQVVLFKVLDSMWQYGIEFMDLDELDACIHGDYDFGSADYEEYELSIDSS